MKIYVAAAFALIICFTPTSQAGNLEVCLQAGKAVNDALRAEAFRVAFGERMDALGIAFYSLSKELQVAVLSDLETLKPAARKSAGALMEKVPEWNMQNMDGLALARDVLTKSYGPDNEGYALLCLKRLN